MGAPAAGDERPGPADSGTHIEAACSISRSCISTNSRAAGSRPDPEGASAAPRRLRWNSWLPSRFSRVRTRRTSVLRERPMRRAAAEKLRSSATCRKARSSLGPMSFRFRFGRPRHASPSNENNALPPCLQKTKSGGMPFASPKLGRFGQILPDVAARIRPGFDDAARPGARPCRPLPRPRPMHTQARRTPPPAIARDRCPRFRGLRSSRPHRPGPAVPEAGRRPCPASAGATAG